MCHSQHKVCVRLVSLLTYVVCVKWKITLCILMGQSDVNMPKHVVRSLVLSLFICNTGSKVCVKLNFFCFSVPRVLLTWEFYCCVYVAWTNFTVAFMCPEQILQKWPTRCNCVGQFMCPEQILQKWPTRCNCVVQFIIPLFLDCSTRFERYYRSSSGASKL